LEHMALSASRQELFAGTSQLLQDVVTEARNGGFPVFYSQLLLGDAQVNPNPQSWRLNLLIEDGRDQTSRNVDIPVALPLRGGTADLMYRMTIIIFPLYERVNRVNRVNRQTERCCTSCLPGDVSHRSKRSAQIVPIGQLPTCSSDSKPIK